MLLGKQATENTKTERKESVRIMIDMSKAKDSRECEGEVNPRTGLTDRGWMHIHPSHEFQVKCGAR